MRSAVNRINHRFHQMKPGSVLILVVALLVLMALIGAAFLSGSQTDRYAVEQHTNNTSIDLVLAGVGNMAKATIVGSLYDSSQVSSVALANTYRPANGTLSHNWTAPDLYHQFTTDKLISTTPTDAWLSPRLPEYDSTVIQTQAAPPFALAPVAWPCIGQPLFGNTFESPFVYDLNTAAFSAVTPLTYSTRMTSTWVPGSYIGGPVTSPNWLSPIYFTMKNADGTTTTVPAFCFIDPATAAATPPKLRYIYLAGDADGDGVADCGMVRLPVGTVDGLTYYAGVRIVDNSSAVNVSTSLSRRFDFAGGGGVTRAFSGSAYTYNGLFNLGCFSGNIGLAELLHNYTSAGTTIGTLGPEFNSLNVTRLNGSTFGGVATANPPTVTTQAPLDEFNVAHPDFVYSTLGDLLYSQIARRPDFPGYVSGVAGSGVRGVSSTPGDAAALAYHFALRNPSASATPLETNLLTSVYTSAPNSPTVNAGTYMTSTSTSYSSGAGTVQNAASVAQWFKDSFDYLGLIGATPDSCLTPNASGSLTDLPRRTVLTGLSTTSNLVPRPQGVLPPQIVSALNDDPPGTGTFSPTMCKACINTAFPGQLWRAFWLSMISDNGTIQTSPMGDDAIGATFPGHGLAAGDSIYTGSTWVQSNSIPDTTTQNSKAFAASLTATENPQRMFRSSIRVPVGTRPASPSAASPYIVAHDMVLLRSAIAAVNTMAMRDIASGVVPATGLHYLDVPLTDSGVGTARVFGVPQQPYITEIYANNNTYQGNGNTNTKAYVAIELFNPYATTIQLNNWQLVAVDRTSGGTRTVTVIKTFGAADNVPGSTGGEQQGINTLTNAPYPPYRGGYALIENLGVAGVTMRPTSTNLPPNSVEMRTAAPGNTTAQGTLPLVDIQSVNLDQAIGKELMLVRPRATTVSVTAEGSPIPVASIPDTVPVDSYDFTGMPPDSGTNMRVDVWHYDRPTATDNTNVDGLWRFIYPGRYDATDTGGAYTAPTFPRRQQGTEALQYYPYPPVPPAVPQSPTQEPPLAGAVTFNSTVGLVAKSSDNTSASYPVTFPFQYLNQDQPGPYPVGGGAVNTYPFGAFARNSDILQVPFVGSYVITSGTSIVELNPITMDCSFAEDTDLSDDPLSTAYVGVTTDDTSVVGPWYTSESVGHFAPINFPPLSSVVNRRVFLNGEQVNDSDSTLAYTSTASPQDPNVPYEASSAAQTFVWRYRWASRLFDYLTVQSPADDNFPNAPRGYPTSAPAPNSPASGGFAGDGTNGVENTSPVYGLININTAPWRVLAALRFCPYDDADTTTVTNNGFTTLRNAQFVWDTVTNPLLPSFRLRLATDTAIPVQPDNVSLAQAIVYFRDRNAVTTVAPQITPGANPTYYYPYNYLKGPFASLAELLGVPAVNIYVQQLAFQAGGIEPGVDFGHLSPNFNGTGTPPIDGVRNDTEERYDLLDRIGNQATVRSDTFTVYIIVQGWRNAGSTSASAPPQLVTQRRAAFFVDRSSVNPTNTEPRVYPIPQE